MDSLGELHWIRLVDAAGVGPDVRNARGSGLGTETRKLWRPALLGGAPTTACLYLLTHIHTTAATPARYWIPYINREYKNASKKSDEVQWDIEVEIL